MLLKRGYSIINGKIDKQHLLSGASQSVLLKKSFATQYICKVFIKRTIFKITIITFRKLLLYFEITDIIHFSPEFFETLIGVI